MTLNLDHWPLITRLNKDHWTRATYDHWSLQWQQIVTTGHWKLVATKSTEHGLLMTTNHSNDHKSWPLATWTVVTTNSNAVVTDGSRIYGKLRIPPRVIFFASFLRLIQHRNVSAVISTRHIYDLITELPSYLNPHTSLIPVDDSFCFWLQQQRITTWFATRLNFPPVRWLCSLRRVFSEGKHGEAVSLVTGRLSYRSFCNSSRPTVPDSIQMKAGDLSLGLTPIRLPSSARTGYKSKLPLEVSGNVE
jgi:hypothetical protein